jgi:Holliday junction resolvase RusA-like endonuclease
MITLIFPGIRPQSKRNSQFAHGRPYVEPHYRRWRAIFGMLARGQWLTDGFRLKEPLAEPVSVSVTFATASGVMRGDLDNSFAAVADGLMDGGVLDDDKWIRRLSAEVVKVPKANVGITVRIEAIDTTEAAG